MSDETRPVLRLNLGDPSEARIYYAAHLIAEAYGFFAQEGVDVVCLRTASGGHSVWGGQVSAVLSGDADLCIGGPMVVMRMAQDGAAQLTCFCAAVAGNPWALAALEDAEDFSLAALAGRRVIDSGRVGTATMSFQTLIGEAGLAEGAVTLIEGEGDLARDRETLARGEADYVLHSLHALAPMLSDGTLRLVMPLTAAMGPVPWSAYIARPETLAARRPAFAAFTRAIARALEAMRLLSARDLAGVVAPHHPDMEFGAVRLGLSLYRDAGLFPETPVIARTEFDRFADLLTRIGWLSAPPAFEAVVDTDLATLAART
ncbi:ABC transporter substrate-binding protein [Segnochrobactrum spirostomi]|uniref:ABC transporter substrate-binding protein n=1 Tax=Segnochrobactrum spirostomi TaxID=2608987 RepID=UPI001AD7FF0C|nr:ABC transporter substrate-binding protein [Segnochrobactrum spirostomi]